jgi:hypothetical protein
VIEPAVGIIAACVTTFRPLVKHLGFGWNTTGNNYASGHVQLSNVNHSDRFGDSSRRGTRRSRHQSALDSRSGSSEKGFIHVSQTVHIQVESRPGYSQDEEAMPGQPEGIMSRKSSETEIRSYFDAPSRADTVRRDEWGGVGVPAKAYMG